MSEAREPSKDSPFYSLTLSTPDRNQHHLSRQLDGHGRASSRPFKTAILANAAAVIIRHKHPSGSVDPSPEDMELSGRLREAGELLGIRVLDSIVLGEGESLYSVVDAGLW